MKLSATGLGKRYGNGVLAVDDVSFGVASGSMHALCGENGAGKSTLLKLLYGLEPPDQGSVSIDDRPLVLRDPRQAIAAGIGLVPQHPMLVGSLSAAENLVLGHEPRSRSRFGGADAAAARARLVELSRRHGLPIEPDVRADTLSAGLQQRLEILKALHRGAKLLLLDEPTALLTPHEAQALFATLAALRADGMTLVLVTHKLGEVRAACDTFTVLRRGRVAGSGFVNDVSDVLLTELIVGARSPAARAEPAHEPTLHRRDASAAPLVDVRHLSLARPTGRPELLDVSLQIAAGEVLGVAAVEGNGANRLAEVLSGEREPSLGQACIDGRPFTGRGVRCARRLGVCAVPEDRLHGGLAPSMSVTDNAVATRYRETPFARGGVLRPAAMAAAASAIVERFAVKAPGVDAAIGSLSGGNMQKVLVGREIAAAPRLLIVSQPTRGVDIGAARLLRDALRELRAGGCALLLISADLDELLGLSDRIVVMFEGRIAAEFAAAQTNTAQLGACMTGGDHALLAAAIPPIWRETEPA